jgi:probable rRNA maturation factor
MNNNQRIYIENQQGKVAAGEELYKLIEDTVLTCLKHENFNYNCEIYIMLTDNDNIQKLNKEFRDIDSPTDVLSFPLINMVEGDITSLEGDINLDENALMLGDIVISLETANKQAIEYEHSLERELTFLTSHGIYHLLGYDHQDFDSEMKMITKQEEVLKILGLERRKP